MEKENAREKVVKANRFGVITLQLFIVQIVLLVALIFLFPENYIMSTIFSSLSTLAILYVYREFLRGFIPIVESVSDNRLKGGVDNFIRATIITGAVFVVLPLLSLLSDSTEDMSPFVIIDIAALVYLGVVSLDISKGFESVSEKLGKPAEEAAKYHKYAGYFLISVILSSVGLILSLVADYKMWKVQKTYLKNDAGLADMVNRT